MDKKIKEEYKIDKVSITKRKKTYTVLPDNELINIWIENFKKDGTDILNEISETKSAISDYELRLKGARFEEERDMYLSNIVNHKEYLNRLYELDVAKKIWDIAKVSPSYGNAVMDVIGDEAYQKVMKLQIDDSDNLEYDCFDLAGLISNTYAGIRAFTFYFNLILEECTHAYSIGYEGRDYIYSRISKSQLLSFMYSIMGIIKSDSEKIINDTPSVNKKLLFRGFDIFDTIEDNHTFSINLLIQTKLKFELFLKEDKELGVFMDPNKSMAEISTNEINECRAMFNNLFEILDKMVSVTNPLINEWIKNKKEKK